MIDLDRLMALMDPSALDRINAAHWASTLSRTDAEIKAAVDRRLLEILKARPESEPD